MADTLSVRAVGATLVCNYEALEAGARRFIGREFLPGVGAQGGWPASKDAVKVPVTHEYLKSLRDGSLVAADKATADRAGIEFNEELVGAEKKAAAEFWAAQEKGATESPTKVEGKSAPPSDAKKVEG